MCWLFGDGIRARKKIERHGYDFKEKVKSSKIIVKNSIVTWKSHTLHATTTNRPRIVSSVHIEEKPIVIHDELALPDHKHSNDSIDSHTPEVSFICMSSGFKLSVECSGKHSNSFPRAIKNALASRVTWEVCPSRNERHFFQLSFPVSFKITQIFQAF
jgi:hypothetical protein